MKNLFVMSLFFFAFLPSHGQISQLEDSLPFLEGIKQVEALNRLSELELVSNPKKSLGYAKRSLTLAKELNDPSAIVAGHLNQGDAYLELGQFIESIPHFSSALKICEIYVNEQGKAYCYLKLGLAYRNIGKYKEAKKNLNSSLVINQEVNNLEGLSHTISVLGDLCLKQKQYKEAIYYYEKALVIDQKRNYTKGIASALNAMGAAYANYGDFELALTKLKEARKIAETGGFTDLVNSTNKSISIVENNLSKYGETKTEFEKEKEQNADTYIDLQILEKTSTFIERIEKLSAENQLKELKMKVQKEEHQKNLLVKQHESEQQAKAIQLLNAETEKKEADMAALKAEANNRLIIMWSQVVALFFVLALALITYKRYAEKRKANQLLETQKEEIAFQKEKIEENRDQLALQHRRITDSIEYAKRIQRAIMTPVAEMKQLLPDSFVMLRPKAKVSGDFFWVKGKNETVLFAAVDCTGHGVPGGFMSIIANNLLTHIASENNSILPGDMLDQISLRLMAMLDKQQAESSKTSTGKRTAWKVKDGMDLALCSLNKKTLELSFAGAHSPLYLIRKNKLQEFKGDRLFIGNTKPSDKFKTHTIQLEKGDCLYLFSDGFADQRGGPENKKYYYAPFQNLLISIHKKPFTDQQKLLKDNFKAWMGNNDQVDDVIVLGIMV